jgi:hypothetical protein
MTPFQWSRGEGLDPARFAEARKQLLSAAQWLARIERSYGSRAAAGDISLRWSDDRNVIATHRFAGDIGVELQIDDLIMQFTERGQPSDHEIDVEERSPAHVEAWILIELLHRGVDRDRFSKDLPYDTSALMSGDGVEFSPGEYGAELKALAAWFRDAVSAIRNAAQGEDGATLRISPRDLRVELTSRGRALGFSPGDADAPEPFFYVARADEGGGARATPQAVLKASDIPSNGPAEAVAAFLAQDDTPTRH